MPLHLQPFADQAPMALINLMTRVALVQHAAAVGHGLHVLLGVAQRDQVGDLQAGKKLTQCFVGAGAGADAPGTGVGGAGSSPTCGRCAASSSTLWLIRRKISGDDKSTADMLKFYSAKFT